MKSIQAHERIWEKLMKLKKTLGCHNMSEVLQKLLENYEEKKKWIENL